MGSFCKTGMVILVSMGWAAGAAQAQSDGYGMPSLLPLPSATPTLSNPKAASYSEASAPASPLGTPFYSNNQSSGQAQTQTWGNDESSLNPIGAACDTCDSCNTCNSCCGPRWFGAVGGLAMSRNRANPFWTTYQTNNNVNQLLNTQNAGAGWAGGGQITAGVIGCCGTGLAFTYWGLAPMTGFTSITDPNNNLSTPINLQTQTGNVMIGTNPASFYFDNSHEQTISRADYVNSFEINVFQAYLVNNSRLQVAALAGFRYFRFGENLTYGAVAFGHNFGDNGGADQAYLGFSCINNLYGAQIGSLINYRVTDRLGVFFIPKAGIFSNQMNCTAQLYSGDGMQGFNISAHKTDASFLGELDTGLNWAFTQNIRGYIGYRVVGLANVALGDNQFLPFLADTQGFGQVKQNGSLLLYGGFAGVAWAF